MLSQFGSFSAYILPLPEEQQKSAFTVRDEANALTALAFRNGFLEELHAGKHHPALDDPEVSRISNDEMKRLMVETSQRLAELLHLKETAPDEYLKQLDFAWRYCRNWDRTWPLPQE